MKPTLLVMAAGMGSRYGGLKQIDGLGPCGETIMDYSVYDAIRAGFGKIVFVIRHDFEEDFRNIVLKKYNDHIAVEVVFQSLDDLPEGFKCPEGRTKPWGTNHAILMAANTIKEPFAVINADDFYGRESFEVMAKELSKYADSPLRDSSIADSPRQAASPVEFCMIGYRVGNTLSASGTVTRGICATDAEGYLSAIQETQNIGRREGEICYPLPDGSYQTVPADQPVSMNFWGFTPDYFRFGKESFVNFLREGIDKPKSESYIPSVVGELIKSGKARVKVFDTKAKWFGVTYSEDRPTVVAKFKELSDNGEYASPLFK